MRHLITLSDLSTAQIERIFSISRDLKAKHAQGLRERLLPGRVMALLFEKQSLRTRVSFESGMVHLGGSSMFLGQDVGFGSRESMADFGRVRPRTRLQRMAGRAGRMVEIYVALLRRALAHPVLVSVTAALLTIGLVVAAFATQDKTVDLVGAPEVNRKIHEWMDRAKELYATGETQEAKAAGSAAALPAESGPSRFSY